MRSIQVTYQSVPAARRAGQFCDHCGGPFGLVTHRWWGSKFCRRRCKEAHMHEMMLKLRAFASARRGTAIVSQFGWSCSRGLRTVISVMLILSFSASFSDSEAWYCGKSFDFRAARIRWASTRQDGPRSEDADQACRAYRNQFYEAMEARQTVSQCQAGADRQKGIEILDAEIDAFNNLIATRCGI
jgi:hypothetical protein